MSATEKEAREVVIQRGLSPSEFVPERVLYDIISDMEKIAADIYSFENQRKGDRRPVTFVGINFKSAKRNIDEPLFGELR